MKKIYKILITAFLLTVIFIAVGFALRLSGIKDERKLLASIPDKKINLYYKVENEEEEMFSGFYLTKGFEVKYIEGEAVTNPSFFPALALLHDEEHILIPLTEGYGSGFLYSKAHIVNLKTFKEVPFEDPMEVLSQRMQSTIDLENNCVKIRIDDFLLAVDTTDVGDTSDDFFENIGCGDSFFYYVDDDTLAAQVNLRISPAEFIGHAKLEYEYREGCYEVSDISFESYFDLLSEQTAHTVQELEELMTAFYVAYFHGDSNAVEKLLAEDFEWDLEVYEDSEHADELEILQIKGLQQIDEKNPLDSYELSVEFRIPNEDSLTYLSVSCVKENGSWKIRGYGLEK